MSADDKPRKNKGEARSPITGGDRVFEVALGRLSAPALDWTARLNAELDAFRRPLKELEAISRPLKEFEAISRPFKELEKTGKLLQAIRDQFGGELRQLSKVLNATNSVVHELAAVARAHQDVSHQLAALAQRTAVQFNVESWTDLRGYAEAAFSAAEPEFKEIVGAAETKSATARAQLPKVTARAKGSVVVGRADGEQATQNTEDGGTIPTRVGVEWFDALPVWQRIFIIYLVIHWLPGLLALAADRWLRDDDAESREVIVREVHEFAGEEASTMLRCVRATTLRVREQPASDARVLDRVAAQQAVVVLDTRERWARIEYVHKGSGELRTGWVAVTFLSTFAC